MQAYNKTFWRNNNNYILDKETYKLGQFKTLGISENIMKSLSEMGFEEPTPIQTKSIPPPLFKNMT